MEKKQKGVMSTIQGGAEASLDFLFGKGTASGIYKAGGSVERGEYAKAASHAKQPAINIGTEVALGIALGGAARLGAKAFAAARRSRSFKHKLDPSDLPRTKNHPWETDMSEWLMKEKRNLEQRKAAARQTGEYLKGKQNGYVVW